MTMIEQLLYMTSPFHSATREWGHKELKKLNFSGVDAFRREITRVLRFSTPMCCPLAKSPVCLLQLILLPRVFYCERLVQIQCDEQPEADNRTHQSLRLRDTLAPRPSAAPKT
jgi:hypothetical protein